MGAARPTRTTGRSKGVRAAQGGPQAPAQLPATPISFLTRRAATAEGKPCTMSTISLGKRRRRVQPVNLRPTPCQAEPPRQGSPSVLSEWSLHSWCQALSTRSCLILRGPSLAPANLELRLQSQGLNCLPQFLSFPDSIFHPSLVHQAPVARPSLNQQSSSHLAPPGSHSLVSQGSASPQAPPLRQTHVTSHP